MLFELPVSFTLTALKNFLEPSKKVIFGKKKKKKPHNSTMRSSFCCFAGITAGTFSQKWYSMLYLGHFKGK